MGVYLFIELYKEKFKKKKSPNLINQNAVTLVERFSGSVGSSLSNTMIRWAGWVFFKFNIGMDREKSNSQNPTAKNTKTCVE